MRVWDCNFNRHNPSEGVPWHSVLGAGLTIKSLLVKLPASLGWITTPGKIITNQSPSSKNCLIYYLFEKKRLNI